MRGHFENTSSWFRPNKKLSYGTQICAEIFYGDKVVRWGRYKGLFWQRRPSCVDCYFAKADCRWTFHRSALEVLESWIYGGLELSQYLFRHSARLHHQLSLQTSTWTNWIAIWQSMQRNSTAETAVKSILRSRRSWMSAGGKNKGLKEISLKWARKKKKA